MATSAVEAEIVSGSAQPFPEHVRAMYESNEVKAGEIISQGTLHYGYFDETNRDATLAEGAERFTRLLIDMSPIREGQRFCDIGCGLGAPAVLLAEQRGCRVDGVTISAHQCRQATRRARAAGLTDRIRFVVADALNLPFGDAEYDGGWFFESIIHMGHAPALREAHRILKPGATLLLADLVALPSASAAFGRYAFDTVHATYIRADEYPPMLRSSGFELLEMIDVTEQVSVPFPRKFREAFDAHREEVLPYVGQGSIDHWVAVHEELSRNLGYVVVRARKMAAV